MQRARHGGIEPDPEGQAALLLGRPAAAAEAAVLEEGPSTGVVLVQQPTAAAVVIPPPPAVDKHINFWQEDELQARAEHPENKVRKSAAS